MRTADPDRPLDQPMPMTSMDDEFNNLANSIDVCTESFMELQTNITKDAALDRYRGCRLVGMDAHMLRRLVHGAIDVGLTIPQVEFLQERLPDLHFMENVMWEAGLEIEPHLYDILTPDSLAMVNHVYDNTEENLPITPLLGAGGVDQPIHEQRGPVEPPLEEFSIDAEFIYLAMEIHDVTRKFMTLQTTMTTALSRYMRCMLLSRRINDLEKLVLAAHHIGFDSLQIAHIESKIPDLVFMEEIVWEQSLEIKPHLPNILESMGKVYSKNLD